MRNFLFSKCAAIPLFPGKKGASELLSSDGEPTFSADMPKADAKPEDGDHKPEAVSTKDASGSNEVDT